MQSHSVENNTIWQFGKGPFLFYGTPPICNGNVELINNSDEKIKVKKIDAVTKNDKGAKAALGHTCEVRLSGKVQSRCCSSVPAHISIDLSTPPGKYSFDLSCGEKRAKAIVHVFEKLDVRVFPDIVRLIGGGGETLSAEIVIKNEGNVPETIKKRSLVYIEEENWIGRSAVYALRNHSVKHDLQSYIDRLKEEFHKTFIPPAKVTLNGKNSLILPGKTEIVQLNITLPKELRKGRTYFTAAQIMNTNTEVSLEIFCNKSVKSQKRRTR